MSDSYSTDTKETTSGSEPIAGARLFSTRALSIYTLAFCFLLLLDAGRAAPMLEREAVEHNLPFLRTVAVLLRTVSKNCGFTALTTMENRLISDLAREQMIGAVPVMAKLPPTIPSSHEKPEYENPAGDTIGSRENVQNPPVASGSVKSTAQTDPSPISQGTAVSTSASDGPETSDPVGKALDTFRKNLPQSQGQKTVSPPEEQKQPDLPNAPTVLGAPSGSSTPQTADKSSPTQKTSQSAPPAHSKQTVLLIGDSMMMEGFGPVLYRTLRTRPELNVLREGKYSTGLSRLDYFDWAGRLTQLVQRDDPDLVIICLGANDPQDIIDEYGRRHHADSSSWAEIYRNRAKKLLHVATSKGAQVIWVGLPVMSKEPYSGRIRRLSDLQKQACTAYPTTGQARRARFVDTLDTLADAKGQYITFAPDQNGQAVRLRYKDKIHVTEEGGRRMTKRVLPFILEALALPLDKQAQNPARAEQPVKAKALDSTP